MLSNAYFLAKFRFDTAENEPAKNLQNFAKFANFADSNPLTRVSRERQGLNEETPGSSAIGSGVLLLPYMMAQVHLFRVLISVARGSAQRYLSRYVAFKVQAIKHVVFMFHVVGVSIFCKPSRKQTCPSMARARVLLSSEKIPSPIRESCVLKSAFRAVSNSADF